MQVESSFLSGDDCSSRLPPILAEIRKFLNSCGFCNIRIGIIYCEYCRNINLPQYRQMSEIMNEALAKFFAERLAYTAIEIPSTVRYLHCKYIHVCTYI